METLIWTLVYNTFVAQMFLFAIPIIGAVWYLIKEVVLLPPSPEKRSQHKKNKKADDVEPPKATYKELLPLNCPSCGAGVPLNETSMTCPHCRTVFPVPPEYEEIRKARQLAIEHIKSAQRYWRIASAITSNFALGIVTLLTAWLIVCLVLILSWIDTPKIAAFNAFLDTYQVPALTLLFWIATLGFIAISISLKFKRDLPKIENIAASATAETVQCKNCGGAIGFDAGQFGSMCGYCGVDTFRVKVARSTALAEDRSAAKASDRLTLEMEHFSEAVEEFLALPTLLTIGVIVLVVAWGVLAIGFSVILAAVVWTIIFVIFGLAYYPIPTLIGLIALVVMWIYRKRLANAVRGFFKR